MSVRPCVSNLKSGITFSSKLVATLRVLWMPKHSLGSVVLQGRVKYSKRKQTANSFILLASKLLVQTRLLETVFCGCSRTTPITVLGCEFWTFDSRFWKDWSQSESQNRQTSLNRDHELVWSLAQFASKTLDWQCRSWSVFSSFSASPAASSFVTLLRVSAPSSVILASGRKHSRTDCAFIRKSINRNSASVSFTAKTYKNKQKAIRMFITQSKSVRNTAWRFCNRWILQRLSNLQHRKPLTCTRLDRTSSI